MPSNHTTNEKHDQPRDQNFSISAMNMKDIVCHYSQTGTREFHPETRPYWKQNSFYARIKVSMPELIYTRVYKTIF